MNHNLIFKNAITAGLIYIILKVSAFIIGIDMKSATDWGILAITISLFIFFGKFYALDIESNENKFGTIFLHGFMASLIFIAFISVFTVIYVKFIDVDFYKKIFDMAEAEMKNHNMDMDKEKMQEMIRLSKKYMTIPYLLLSTFLSNIIMCNIGNFIGAIAFRNKN